PDDVWADVLWNRILHLSFDRPGGAGVAAGEDVGWEDAAGPRRARVDREIGDGSGAARGFGGRAGDGIAGGAGNVGIAERRRGAAGGRVDGRGAAADSGAEFFGAAQRG